MGGENHEKREAKHLQQENSEREGGAPMGGGRWVLVAGAPSTEKGNGFKPALRRRKR
jgi:hypothetical protein